MDYTTLIADKGTLGSIKAWANYDKLPSEDILEAAQATIYTVLRVRETQEFFTGTITTSTLALPDNFREPIRIRHLNSNPGTISIQPANRFDERLVYTGGVLPVGEPTECTFDAENVYFNKTPAAPLPFKMWYTAKVEDLSPSNPRNFLTDRYPNILRAACMYWASGFDKRIDRDHWQSVMTALIEAANAEVMAEPEAEASADGAYSYGLLTGPRARAGSIRSLLKSDEAAAQVILNEAQALVFSMLRVREMKTEVAFTIDPDDTTLALPERFREFLPGGIKLITPWPGNIRILDEELFNSRLGYSDGLLIRSTPTECYVDKDVIRLNTRADQTYTGLFYYWKTPPYLSASVSTNFLTEKYPHLLTAACLSIGYLHAQNLELHDTTTRRLSDLIYQTNAEYDLSRQAQEAEIFWRN